MASFVYVTRVCHLMRNDSTDTSRSNDFAHDRYSSFRPTYPSSLYDTILDYHQGPRKVALDLGTGHGLVARELGKRFDQVHASDPSPGMLQLAQQITTAQSSNNHGNSNIAFHASTAETSSQFLAPASVDLVTAAQAVHWFDYDKMWPDLGRVVRPGGTVAFWGYTDPIVVSYPHASALLSQYAESMDPTLLGPYWQQPGRAIVQGKLRAVQPPELQWVETRRVEYEPRTGDGVRFLRKAMTLGDVAEFVRTWSAYHGWLGRWRDDQTRRRVDDGGPGDVVDDLMAKMIEEEPGLVDGLVELEWGTGLVLTRRA